MKIVSSKAAEKDILALEKITAQRIASKITQLADNPYPEGSKKLEGGKGYRIRMGDYRIVYLVDKTNKMVTIIKVKHRREVYR